MTIQVTPAAQAVRGAAGGSYYGLMYLAFATIAYTDEEANAIVNVNTDVDTLVRKQPPPPLPNGGALQGAWSVDWGPALYHTDENLMFIASFRETGNPNPVLTILSIRGTDTSAGASAVLGELFEDVADWTRVLWSRASADQGRECLPDLDPFDDSQPKIASGTCIGLGRLRGMTAPAGSPGASTTAMQCLQTLLAADPQLPVVVTGHSLGGCQATVMAMYLAGALPPGTRVISNPFAPPTAGNAAFAALYDAQFGNDAGRVWWNTLDLVPSAFAKTKATPTPPGNLIYAEELWQNFTYTQDGQTSPGPGNVLLRSTIKLLEGTLPEYTQPAAGSMQLNGAVASPELVLEWLESMPDPSKNPHPASWDSQLLWQHFPPNYYLLMKGQVAGLALYAYPVPSQLPTGT